MGSQHIDGDVAISEIAIVDIFTRVIFDAETLLDDTEQFLLDMLCCIEPILAEANRRDISEYLRTMAVKEMIKVVEQIKDQFTQQHMLTISSPYLHSPLFRH